MEKTNQVPESFLYRNSFILFIGAFFTGVLGYLFHSVVSRYLSVAQYGELQSLISVFQILSVFVLTLSYFGVKFTAVFADAKDTGSTRQFIVWVRGKAWVAALWVLFFYLIMSPLLFRYLHLESVLGLVLVGVTVALSIVAMSDLSALVGWENFISYSIANVVGVVFKFLIGLFLLLIIPEVSVAIGAFLVASVVTWWIAFIANRRKFGQKRTEELDWQKKYFSSGEIWKNMAPIFLFSLLITLIVHLDVLVIKSLSSAEVTGYYSALSLLGKIVLWGNLTVVTAVLPGAVARRHIGKPVSRQTIVTAYGLIVGISSLMMVLYFSFSSQIVGLFFGMQYTKYSGSLWLFAVLAMFSALLQLESNFAFARSDWRVLYLLFLTALLIVFCIMVYQDSIRNIAISIICALVVGYVGILLLNMGDYKKGVIVIREDVS